MAVVASNINALTLELLPDFHDAIALHIVIPDSLDFIAQQLVLFGTSASQFGLTGFGCMHVITGRSDLDYPTDRLDSVAVTVLVNEGVQGLLRRRGAGQSGSAWAKYALARRRISFALRSFPVLAFQSLDAFSFLGRLAGAVANISLVFAYPAMQRLGDTANLGRNGFDGCPFGGGSPSGSPEPCAQHVHGLQGNSY